MSELRLILLGSSWSDKSSVANFLLEKNAFNKNEESNTSIKVSGMIKTTKAVVINTPDLLRQSISEPRLREHVEHCVGLSAPGPHVFLLVVEQNISDQQKKRLYRILDLFSNDSFKHSLVLISTPGWETSGSNYPFHQRPLQDLIRMCGDNSIRLQQDPNELLWNLSHMLRNNCGDHVVCGGPSLKPIKRDSLPLDSSQGPDDVRTEQHSSLDFLPPHFPQQTQPPALPAFTETKDPEPSGGVKAIVSRMQARQQQQQQQQQPQVKVYYQFKIKRKPISSQKPFMSMWEAQQQQQHQQQQQQPPVQGSFQQNKTPEPISSRKPILSMWDGGSVE
ncbi:GTPase IMAP family member 2-like [Fundulus heteroclitus]|uniref:GTPase IMAP family member 2-like n=1 Tax=Fundulus heteroclitus TaxID=8078 RepID=UPI00165C5DAB|nr:GTPase IMAP family member 2-like [Fundulus heteroclitus]